MAGLQKPSKLSNKLHQLLFAWLLVFTCSQTIAAEHIHLDTVFDNDCVACVQGLDSPLLPSELSQYRSAPVPADAYVGTTEQPLPKAPPAPYR
ncbi:MAG: hypothetical protein ACSHWQ_08325, partial [Spongiibacteraceae bacterium]